MTDIAALRGIKPRKVGAKDALERQIRGGVEKMGDVAPPPDKPGHRFAYWIGLVFAETREDHDLTKEDVASYTGSSYKTIHNFETNVSRPQDEEGIVAGLAELCGLTDPRDLYADALRRWYREGEPPDAKRGRGQSGLAGA